MKPNLIFDAHLDLSWNAMDQNRDLRWSLERIRRRELGMTDKSSGRNTVCLPEMRRGSVGLCVATQLARYLPYFGRNPGLGRINGRFSPEQAWAASQGQLAWYREMETCGEMVQIRDRKQLEAHLALWQGTAPGGSPKLPIGYILSLEGADSIVSFKHLEKSYADGLRALGPAHFGPGIYAHGTDDEGPMTPRGHDLLKEMERLGIILDVSHLCDESFWDAIGRFKGPLWASHSNCRVLSNWNRQFNDDQIKELIRRDTVIGMVFDAKMMVHGWSEMRSQPKDFNLRIEKICEHIDHICQLAGSARNIGIGSDLDGGFGNEQTPLDLDSIADLVNLGDCFAARGYPPDAIDGIFYGNFVDFLRRAWR
ncbi:MAG: peptidase M19 [Opitutaceae bacterium]|nr:peptidase M19 [Opitutaceae bacterium]